MRTKPADAELILKLYEMRRETRNFASVSNGVETY
jgi:hypothetical protein